MKYNASQVNVAASSVRAIQGCPIVCDLTWPRNGGLMPTEPLSLGFLFRHCQRL